MSFASSTREPGLDFDRAIALPDHSPTPRFVVANMNSWNFSKSAFVDSHASSDGRNASIVSIESRPKTSSGVSSHGILNRPKRQSFSRPLTSEGPKSEIIPPPPRLPMDFLPRSDSITTTPAPIGLALGSPSVPNHEALKFNLNGPASAPFEPTYTTFSPGAPSKSLTPTQPSERQQPQKSKRWITMGNLFKKKTPATTSPAPAADPPKPAKLIRKSQDSGSGGRRRSLSRRMSLSSSLRSKPDSEELPPMPPKLDLEQVRSKESIARPATSSKGSIRPTTSSKDSVKRPATGSKESAAISTPQLRLPAQNDDDDADRPTLEIDIPQTKLDRYSIMFSDVLSQPFFPERPALGLPQTSDFRKSTTLELPSSTSKTRQDAPRSPQLMSQRRLPSPGPAPSQPPPPAQPRLASEKRKAPAAKPHPPSDPSLQRRRKPDMEKLSPLNMHRISSSPMFHYEPGTPRSATSIQTAPLPGAFSAPPSPTPQSAPAVTVERAPSRTPSVSKPNAYSLFPKTESSPPLPSSSSFVSEDKESEARQDYSRLNLRTLPEDTKPLRSSSLFPTDDRPDATIPRSPSTQPMLYPPSPPLSSSQSAPVTSTHNLASPSFRSARSSVYSSRRASMLTFEDSDFPSGIEINERDAQAAAATTVGTFDLPGLLSPPHTSEIPSGHFMDDQESVGTPSRSSALGDSPLLGMARSVSLSYRHEKPRFLKTDSDAKDESDDNSSGKDSMHEARANARTPTFVHVDDSDLFEDEESWIRRRSMWGVMEDA